jgi:all-trans-retinol 13,14-reductase
MGDVYDRIIIGDRSYDFVKGRERFREQLHGYFPKETRAIDRYLEKIDATAKKSQLFFAEKAVPSMISSLFGGLMRRPLLKEARVTTRQMLESLTQDQELIGVLTGQWGDYGLVPSESSFFMHAMVVRHYLGGAAYPVGGSSRIAATILPVIEAAGGEVVTNANVEEILIEKGRAVGVRLEDGHELRAPLVLSDAGIANTYGRLLPNDVAEDHGLRRKVELIEPSAGHLSAYIGLQGTTEELQLEKTNLWVYPTPHHEENVRKFLDDRNAPLPLVYLSFPSAKDPDFQRRYPGHSTIEAITLAPYEWFKAWESTSWKKRGADYDAFKDDLETRLLETLYEQAPGTRGRVEICELSTPLTTRNFANHPHGEIYGLAHTPGRFEQRWLRPQTPIKGLYLTGADICSAGVGGALMGGMLCSSAALGRNVLSTVMQRKPRPVHDARPQEASVSA